jgi:hypothetical protein
MLIVKGADLEPDPVLVLENSVQRLMINVQRENGKQGMENR